MTRTPRPRLAATDTHTCLNCGRALRASKEWFVGDDCAEKLGPARVEALRIYAVQQADPMSIPAGQRPLSAQARLNNTDARAASGQVQLCGHDNAIGRCGSCRWEGKPENAATRVLRWIRAQPVEQRRAERTEVQAARVSVGIPTQPAPSGLDAPHDTTNPRPPGAVRMELK